MWHLISRGFTSSMTGTHVESLNYPFAEGTPLHLFSLKISSDRVLRSLFWIGKGEARQGVSKTRECDTTHSSPYTTERGGGVGFLLVLGTYMLRNYGVLVRLTTCKRLTSSLPKLSLIILFPPETAGYQVGRIYGRTCQYPSGFISFLGIPGSIF